MFINTEQLRRSCDQDDLYMVNTQLETKLAKTKYFKRPESYDVF